MADEGLRRLGEAVRDERARRWASMGAFASAVGCSPRTIGKLERGESLVSPRVLDRVEDVLRWRRGHAEQLLAGAWRPPADPDRERLDALWPRLSPRDRWVVAELGRALVDAAERPADMSDRTSRSRR